MSDPYRGWDDRSPGYGPPPAAPPTGAAGPYPGPHWPNPYPPRPGPYATTAPGGYPTPPQYQPPVRPGPPQRPAPVATATTLAMTGSLLFVCGLGLLWLLAFSIRADLDASAEDQTVIYNIAERIHLKLSRGLAIPLFGFPLAAVVTSFLVPGGRRWGRLAFTLAGAAAVVWSAWWLRYSLAWWFPGAIYTAVSVGLLWLPSVRAWYAAVDPPDQPGAGAPPGPVQPAPGRPWSNGG